LPAIRKTGSYSVSNVAPVAARPITVDLRIRGQMAEVLVQALQIAEEERERADLEHARADRAEAVVESQRPDVEFVERFVDSDSLFGIREAAKTLHVNERDLIAWLEAKGYVTRLRGRLMPSHTGKVRGYVVSKIEEWRNADGDTKAKPRAWITTKGLEHFGKNYDGPRKPQLALAVVG
jgi:phage antirepressor YoqD-like protein